MRPYLPEGYNNLLRFASKLIFRHLAYVCRKGLDMKQKLFQLEKELTLFKHTDRCLRTTFAPSKFLPRLLFPLRRDSMPSNKFESVQRAVEGRIRASAQFMR